MSGPDRRPGVQAGCRRTCWRPWANASTSPDGSATTRSTPRWCRSGSPPTRSPTSSSPVWRSLSLDHLHHLAVLAHGSGVRLWLVADHVVSAALHGTCSSLADPRDASPRLRRPLVGVARTTRPRRLDWTTWTRTGRPRCPTSTSRSSSPKPDPGWLPDEAEAWLSGFLKAFRKSPPAARSRRRRGSRRGLGWLTCCRRFSVAAHPPGDGHPCTRFSGCCVRPPVAGARRPGHFLSSGSDHLAAVAANPETWRSLRAYAQPYRAAACALVAAGLDLEGLEQPPPRRSPRQRLASDIDLDLDLSVPGADDAAASGAVGLLTGWSWPEGRRCLSVRWCCSAWLKELRRTTGCSRRLGSASGPAPSAGRWMRQPPSWVSCSPPGRFAARPKPSKQWRATSRGERPADRPAETEELRMILDTEADPVPPP
jgi:hypothetical protein